MPKNINEEYEYVIDRGNVFSTNFKIIESYNNATLSGYPAYKLVWTEAINDTGIKVMEIGIISNGHVYAMEYRAEPERYSYYLPIIQQMLDSLKIKELKSIVATDD
jgi:hypothetical protein